MALEQQSRKFRVQIMASDNKLSNSEIDVVMDVSDVITIGSEIRMKTKKFKKKYLKLIDDAQKIMPQQQATYKNKESKKRSKKSVKINASVYWNLGDLFRKFNDNVENEFEITNYGAALQRDFGLTMRYVQELIIFASLFEKKEINDFVPMAIYRALVWKKNQLEEINELENEKNKLLEKGKKKIFIGRENYKKELQLVVDRKVNQETMLCCKCKSAQTDDFKRFGPWMCNSCKSEVSK